MAWQLVLKEKMSGWIALARGGAGERQRYPFLLDVDAVTPKILTFGAVRTLNGEVSFGGALPTVPVTGTLVLTATGPHYELEFTLPGFGAMRLVGRKRYDLRDLRTSLITLPLRVLAANRNIGEAELVYRDSILTFPLTALRLRQAG